MHGITGLTQLLKHFDYPDERMEIIDGIQSCTDMLMALISDILDISKVEIGAENLIKSNFDINTLVEGIVDVLALVTIIFFVLLFFFIHLILIYFQI